MYDTGEIKPDESSMPVKLEKEGEFKYYCMTPLDADTVSDKEARETVNYILKTFK